MPEESSPSPNPTDPAVELFIRQALEAKKKPAAIFTHPTLEPKERVRRTAAAGMILGITASLVFAFLTQWWNILLLPGLPLYQSIFDPLFNTVVIIIVGTIFTLVAVSSLKIQDRAIMLVLILLACLVFYRVYQVYGNIFGAFMESLAFFFLFLIPIFLAFLCLALFGALIRWAVHAQVKYFYHPIHHWKRVIPFNVLLLIIVFAGRLFIFSTPEQKAIRNMEALVEEARLSQTDQALPKLVRDMWGTPFHPYAKGTYFLISQHNPIPERFNPDSSPLMEGIFVSAQFQSGYWFTCEFAPNGSPLECFSEYEPPYSDGNL